MAHVLRLIFVAFVATFAMCAGAAIPKVDQYQTTAYAAGGGTGPVLGPFSTPQAVCGPWFASYKAVQEAIAGRTATDQGWQATPVPNGSCLAKNSAGGSSSANIVKLAQQACPANSVASGSSCACSSPYVENSTHTACVPPPTSAEKWKSWCQAAIGQSLGPLTVPGRGAGGGCLGGIDLAGSPIETPGYAPGDVPAGGGCSFDFGGSISYKDDAGAYQTQGTGAVNGGTCVQGNAPIPTDAPPDTTQAPPSSPDPCPNGYPGTVNGSTVCASRDPTSGIEGVKGTDTKNADGTSTSTKETTKCNAGVCTTTKETTTKDASGNVVGTPKVEETKQSIGDKCNADPGNKVCSEVGMGNGEGGAGFSGNCVSGFVAKGEDPILNAMALEQYKRNCEVLNQTTPDSTWVTNERDRTTDRTLDNPNNSTVSVSAADIDTSDALGGGAHCIVDKVVQVAGFSVALPFSKVCPYLELLGNVLLGVALLAAARIVIKG
jgi:hypothetical protein